MRILVLSDTDDRPVQVLAGLSDVRITITVSERAEVADRALVAEIRAPAACLATPTVVPATPAPAQPPRLDVAVPVATRLLARREQNRLRARARRAAQRAEREGSPRSVNAA